MSFALLSLIVLISQEGQAAPVVKLDSSALRVSLPAYVDVLEDSKGTISIREIRNKKYDHQFSPAPLSNLFFGYTYSVYWLRFTVESQLDKRQSLILEIVPADIDHIDIFSFDAKSGEQLFHKQSGSAVDFDQRDYDHPLYYFDMEVTPKSSQVVYVRLESNKSINTRLMLSTPAEHFFYASMRDWWQGFLFGALLLLFILNLVSAFIFKKKSFVYAGLWIFSMLLMQGSWNGYFIQFLDTDESLLDKQLIFSVCFSMVFAILFIRSYLDTHHRSPFSHRVFTGFLMLALMGIPCAWLLNPVQSALIATLIAVPLCFFMIGVGVYSFLEGYQPARYFLLARTVTIVMILIAIFSDRGLLPDSFVVNYGLAVSFLFEGIIFLTVMINLQSKRKHLNDHHASLVDGTEAQSSLFPIPDFCHELRTPISGVMGMTELLLDSDLKDQQRAQAESVHSSGKALKELVDKMSDLASIESGGIELRDSAFEVITLVELCVENARMLSLQQNIELIYQVDETLSGWVRGDRDRLQQVLNYLISFGMRQLDAGEILLTVKSAGSRDMRFEVVAGQNTFVQELAPSRGNALGESAKGSATSGDSLNLMVARQLVTLMGGELTMEWRADGGVQFGFQVPLFKQRQNLVEADPGLVLRGKSLIIIDDNETCCKIIQQQATRWGMEALSAASGKEALSVLQSRADLNKPLDILLVDYEMPGMNGLELLEKIRQSSATLKIDNSLILVLTGVSKMPAQLLDHTLLVHGVLYKPLSGKSLKMALVEALQSDKQHLQE